MEKIFATLDKLQNIKHEILIETYRPWVKKLGQWHLADDDGQTRCGVPMLGNNYANEIPENERTKCAKCFEGEYLTRYWIEGE